MGVLAQSMAEQALEEAIRRDLVDITLVGRRYEELGGDFRLGGKVASRLIHRWIPNIARTDSRPEVRLLRLIAARGLPEPVPQHRVWFGPDECADLDFAWPDERVALEFDSYRWHGGRLKHDADARRELRLQVRRWNVIRVTDAELDAGCPNALPVLAASLAVLRGA
jgi:hypothetical protein